MKLLRLMVDEDDLIPLLLGFIAVNGDLRLYTDYLVTLCRAGKGGSKRLACRYMEYLAVAKEPLVALERLGEELGKKGATLQDITRALRLGLEPSELAEHIVEKIITRLRARAELIDEIAKAGLETLALISTIFTLSLLVSGLFLGSNSFLLASVIAITGIVVVISFLLPSIMSLASPRIPAHIYAFTITSQAAAVLGVYLGSLHATLVSVILAIPVYLFARRWWRQVKDAARLALQLAEALQMGRITLLASSEGSLAYNVIVGSRKNIYSNLGTLLIDMTRLLPQEGSVTAARLLRSFAEFAARYLDIARAMLLRSIVYEALVTSMMPLLGLIMLNISKMLTTSLSIAGAIALPIPRPSKVAFIARLMLLPSVVYPLATSKIGRGSPMLPLLHWLPALAASLLLH